MLRFFCLLLLFGLLCPAASAQRDVLLDTLADATCKCLAEKDLSENMELKAGLCIMDAVTPLKDEIKTLLDLDLDDLSNFPKMAELVGEKLVTRCPDFVKTLRELNTEDDESSIFDKSEDDYWSDMNPESPADQPEYGSPANKKFIVTDLPNTNGSGLAPTTVSGVVRSVESGLSNRIVLRTAAGQTEELYLTDEVPKAELMRKGARVRLGYRLRSQYHVGRGRDEKIKVIVSVSPDSP